VNLILIGRCFVLAFILAVLGSVFPIRFAEIAWQQGVIDTVVNAGSVSITGRVFMLIALLFKGYDSVRLTFEPTVDSLPLLPASGILAKRKIARALRSVQSVIANIFRLIFVFGPSALFAVVAVLQIFVSTQAFRALDTASLNQVTALTQQTTQARASLSAASDPAVLDQAIRALVPAPEQEAISILNPQQQRADLLKRIDDRNLALRNELDRQRTQRFTAIVWLTVKNVLIALLFSYCLFWLRPAAVRNLLKEAN
jgi:hypothetical protein